MTRLCFDYGHGGEDSGALYNGRKGSNDVLRLGRAVASDIKIPKPREQIVFIKGVARIQLG